MHASLLATLLLAAQGQPQLDSATVIRILSQLRTSDSAICALAGQALTNYGGFWGWAYSDPAMPMPRPMPTPMPMPGGGGGGVHVEMHERGSDINPAVLRAFRAFIRDDNRWVRNIAARVLGRHGGSSAYDLFVTLLRDPRPDLRETGALGLGELEDSRAITPLSSVLDRDDSPAVRMTAAWALGEIDDDRAVTPLVAALKDSDIEVRATAAWALGEIDSPLAREGLEAAQSDEAGSVRRAATWALRQIEDDHDPRIRIRPRIKIKP